MKECNLNNIASALAIVFVMCGCTSHKHLQSTSTQSSVAVESDSTTQVSNYHLSETVDEDWEIWEWEFLDASAAQCGIPVLQGDIPVSQCSGTANRQPTKVRYIRRSKKTDTDVAKTDSVSSHSQKAKASESQNSVDEEVKKEPKSFFSYSFILPLLTIIIILVTIRLTRKCLTK